MLITSQPQLQQIWDFFWCQIALESCTTCTVCEYKIKRHGNASVDNHGLANIEFDLKLQRKKPNTNENSLTYSHFEYFLEVLVKIEANCFYVQKKFHFTEIECFAH